MDVTRQVELDAAVADVWRALTDPDELSAWFGAEVQIDPTPGGRAVFGASRADAVRFAVVEDVDLERRLALRWWSGDDGIASTVTFTVEESAGGTRLTVVETAADAKATAAWAARLVDLELLCLSLHLALT